MFIITSLLALSSLAMDRDQARGSEHCPFLQQFALDQSKDIRGRNLASELVDLNKRLSAAGRHSAETEELFEKCKNGLFGGRNTDRPGAFPNPSKVRAENGVFWHEQARAQSDEDFARIEEMVTRVQGLLG